MTQPSDADLNEDWLKTMSWDLGFRTLPGLLAYLNCTNAPTGEQVERVRKFIQLPAWQAAPAQLIQEVSDFLR